MNESATKTKIPTHKKCWAKDCRHRKDTNNCIFSTFPRNPERCKEWLKVVGVKDFVGLPISKLSTLRFICSCHFKLDDYKSIKNGKRLHENAIPSIFSESTTPLTEEDIKDFSPNALTVIPTSPLQVSVQNIKQSDQYSFHNMFSQLKTRQPVEPLKLLPNNVDDKNQLVPVEAVMYQQNVFHNNQECSTGNNSTIVTITSPKKLSSIRKNRAMSLPSFDCENSVEYKSRKRSCSTTDIESVNGSLILRSPLPKKKRYNRCSDLFTKTRDEKWQTQNNISNLKTDRKLMILQKKLIPNGDWNNDGIDQNEMYNLFSKKLKECIGKMQGPAVKEIFLS